MTPSEVAYPAAASVLETQSLPIIGESHADPFFAVTLSDERSGATLAATALAHVAVLQAQNFLEQNGAVGQKIVSALSLLRWLGYNDDPAHPDAIPLETMGTNALSPAWGLGWRRLRWPWMEWTPILFVVGEVDTRMILKALPPTADVETAIPPAALARVPRFEPTAIVAKQSLDGAIDQVLQPLFRSFQLMRTCGLANLALHSISPSTPDDEEYRRVTTHDTRTLVRYKIIMSFNAAMRDFCAREGFIFIDRWDDFTEGGLVRDNYMADAVHVKPEYMRESLVQLYRIATERKAVMAGSAG